MLAQLVDLFSQSTWFGIFAAGWGAPLLAMIIRIALFRKLSIAIWVISVWFYGAIGGSLLLASSQGETPMAVIGLYATLLAGPILAIAILFASRPDVSEHKPRGFPIEPSQHENDMKSK